MVSSCQCTAKLIRNVISKTYQKWNSVQWNASQVTRTPCVPSGSKRARAGTGCSEHLQPQKQYSWLHEVRETWAYYRPPCVCMSHFLHVPPPLHLQPVLSSLANSFPSFHAQPRNHPLGDFPSLPPPPQFGFRAPLLLSQHPWSIPLRPGLTDTILYPSVVILAPSLTGLDSLKTGAMSFWRTTGSIVPGTWIC